jgi:transcriptional regulator with XRE-family HTH domain
MRMGARLREAREARDLTQREVAERLRVSKGSISAWENDRNRPLLDQFIELCRVYAVSADELLSEGSVQRPALGVSENQAVYPANADDFERRMLDLMRKLPPSKKRSVVEILEHLSSGNDPAPAPPE